MPRGLCLQPITKLIQTMPVYKTRTKKIAKPTTNMRTIFGRPPGPSITRVMHSASVGILPRHYGVPVGANIARSFRGPDLWQAWGQATEVQAKLKRKCGNLMCEKALPSNGSARPENDTFSHPRDVERTKQHTLGELRTFKPEF